MPYGKLVDLDHALLQQALHVNMSWECLRDMRALVRLRGGLIVTSHVAYKRSEARLQRCTACNEITDDPYTHALLQCLIFGNERRALFDIIGPPRRCNREAALMLLKLIPADDGFAQLVALSAAIDKASTVFWRSHL